LIGDPLMWLMGLFGVGAAVRAKKDAEQPGADFGKDAESVPHYGILTPARQDFYERAMLETKSPQAFRILADDFEKVGLKEEAKTLRARGDSRAAGLDVHEKRRVIVAQCLDSGDPMVCEEGADICEKLGMTLAARELRNFATGLREQQTLALANQTPATLPGPAQTGAVAIPNEGPGPIVANADPAGTTPQVGVWDDPSEDQRAKGWDHDDAFTRHAEK